VKLTELTENAIDKSKFKSLTNYIDFAEKFLSYVKDNLQAVIISQNENHYQFYQYKKDGMYQITRPINSNLMYDIEEYLKIKNSIIDIIKNSRGLKSKKDRELINKAIYTLQTSIGSTLDALHAGLSNKARKINGDLFEKLIKIIIKEIGIDCKSGVVQIPIKINGKEQFKMSYQHDLVIKRDGEIKLVGSIKTSSKDRIDKIFIDKFLYNKLTNKNIPHIAIFLNDVQRKNGKLKNTYGINATFLPGHFKGYTVKLNPIDGVYYCDIRPNMTKEDILKDYIKTFDYLICEDIWKY